LSFLRVTAGLRSGGLEILEALRFRFGSFLGLCGVGDLIRLVYKSKRTLL